MTKYDTHIIIVVLKIQRLWYCFFWKIYHYSSVNDKNEFIDDLIQVYIHLHYAIMHTQ